MTQNWEAWELLLGLPHETSRVALAAIAVMSVGIFVLVPCAALVSWASRKLGADFQARVGPNRAGGAGVLQSVADWIKLLQKTSAAPLRWNEWSWLLIQSMALFATAAVLPMGSLYLLLDTDLSAILPLWSALLIGLSGLFLGLSQGTVPGWMSGIRIASQTLAGAFPALIAILLVGLRAGDFKWSSILAAQGASPLEWLAFTNPFHFVSFIVFLVSGLVLFGVSPLEGGTSLPDLRGGVYAGLSGRRLSLLRLGRFYAFFLWSALTSILFLGGWLLPGMMRAGLEEVGTAWAVQAVELLVFFIKTGFVMLAVIWVEKVTPRLRSDQVTDLAWKVLSPLSLLSLMGTAIWMVVAL